MKYLVGVLLNFLVIIKVFDPSKEILLQESLYQMRSNFFFEAAPAPPPPRIVWMSMQEINLHSGVCIAPADRLARHHHQAGCTISCWFPGYVTFITIRQFSHCLLLHQLCQLHNFSHVQLQLPQSTILSSPRCFFVGAGISVTNKLLLASMHYSILQVSFATGSVGNLISSVFTSSRLKSAL